MDMSARGIRIVGHGGDTFWFHTLFALFPDHDLGLFVSYSPSDRIPSSARLALWAAAAFLLAMTTALVINMSDPTDLAFGELGTIKALLVLPLIALVPAAIALVASVKIWRRGMGTLSGRICYMLTAALVVAFYWQLAVWNLLGFQL